MQKEKGIVFNIQRYSLHDGPGIRTVVFLKGCPLMCKWCSNPESQEINPELSYNKSRCVKCLNCVSVCPAAAIREIEDGIAIDRSKCTRCFKCADACVAEALKVEGREMSVDEVVDEVMRDELFYRNSGGGVTLSGGEVLVQHTFAAYILKALKKRNINTAIETTGYAKWEVLKEVVRYTDVVLYDLKHVDSSKHKEGTGVDNGLIFENLKLLSKLPLKLIVRIPLIPGFNMDAESIGKYISFLKESNVSEVHVLPFHQLGSQKYVFIDKQYELNDLKTSPDEEVEKIKNTFENEGFRVCIGG